MRHMQLCPVCEPARNQEMPLLGRSMVSGPSLKMKLGTMCRRHMRTSCL